MADSKITALTSISTSTDPANDPLVIVDVSDTSMAATGTTKKVTLNQLLGASGTATLASATITGDLTVRTNKLAVTSTGVGVGTASPLGPFHLVTTAAGYSDAGYFENSQAAAANVGPRLSLLGVGSVAMATIDAGWNAAANTDSYLRFLTRGTSSVQERYRIASDGVATWSNVGGVAGTAMTLNSTGLGVGVSPSYKLDVQGADNSIIAQFGGVGGRKVNFTTSANGGFANGFFNFVSTSSVGAFSFQNANGTLLTIDSSGNLGIGVTSPRSKADVYGTLTVGSNTAPNCDFKRDVAISGADSGIGSLNYGARYDATNYGVGALITGQSAGAWTSTSTPGYISFRTTPSSATTPVERMRLDSSGNVGIGVTPSATNSTYFQALEIARVGQGLTAAKNVLTGSPSSWLSNNSYATYSSGVVWNYAISQPAAQYRLFEGQHQWYNAPSGTAGNAITWTQAMTLDAIRSLHIDTTAYVNIGVGVVNSKNGYNIVPDNTGNAANRNWNFSTNGSAAGNLDIVVSSANNTYPNSAYRMQLTSAGAAYNTTGTWGTISDSRLKENISDARNYLADLLKLRVVKYSLKEEASAVATKLGLIAQEVEQVFPSLVEQSDVAYDGGDGIRTVKTSILVPMLLKAIQELAARVQTLEAK